MITEIEQRLLNCNPDKFANLCRLYLSYKYDIVHSTGLVVGKEKSKKGTPDNFIPIGDFYIFNEITTTGKKGLIPKLKKDIEHCFNQTDVPIEKILKIILICNNEITLLIQEKLNKHKNNINHRVELEVIGVDSLATIIFREYPSIAKELGVPIDTGQVLEIGEFVSQYEKSKFSTPLSNLFFNRDKEIEDSVNLLENNDLLIISGQAGVGKTKFSLELVKIFQERHSGYRVKYIRANGELDIWDDLKVQLIQGKNYVIVVDDANKLRSNLDLIVNFKISFTKSIIKLIFTVRNYAKAELQSRLNNCPTLELESFGKEGLGKILQSPDFNITNFYLDKIYSISKGNARIAIMAAIAGINDVNKLRDASHILEEYFASVSQQLKVEKSLIVTAGILSLFRSINVSHAKSLDEIEKYFKIPRNALIENLELLYKYEIADEYKSSYKIADQILGEYIFYLVFIKQQQIPFSLLLDLYIDENKYSLIKLLAPIVSNYGFDEVKMLIVDDIKNKLNELKDNQKITKFLKDFWFYLPSESLVFIAKHLQEASPDNFEAIFEVYRDNQIEFYEDDTIEILINFQQLPDKFQLALELLMKYALLNQVNFSKMLKALTQSFTYGRYDDASKYQTQVKLFDYLYRKAAEADNIFYSKVVLFIANKYLVDSYQSSYGDHDTVHIQQLPVYLSEEQKNFRMGLWNFIFSCFSNIDLKDAVYNFFDAHRYEHHFFKNEPIVKFDKNLVLDFFNKNFLPDPNFRETKIVHRYLKNLDFYKISYNKGLKRKFQNDEVDLWRLLNERAENKEQLLYQYIENFKLKDYKNLFGRISRIRRYKMNYFAGLSTAHLSVSHILIKLGKSDFKLFLKVFELSFLEEYSVPLLVGKIFKELKFDKFKAQKIRKLILEGKVSKECLPTFLANLPIEHIIDQDYKMFIDFIGDEKINNISFIEDVFEKFKRINIDIEKGLHQIFDLLFKKSTTPGFYLSDDFFEYVYETYPHIFFSRLENIQSLYLRLDEGGTHFDYELKVLKRILAVNSKFINDVLKSNFEDKYFISKRDFLENDFKRLWDLENRNDVFEYIIKFTSKFQPVVRNVSSDVSIIFQGSEDKGLNFIHYLFDKTDDRIVLNLLFNIVISQYNQSKYDFLHIILSRNLGIEFFKELYFYAGSFVTVGDRIPKIRQEITVYEELKGYLQGLNDIRYLEHINFVEQEIIRFKSEIEWERKRDFLREWSL